MHLHLIVRIVHQMMFNARMMKIIFTEHLILNLNLNFMDNNIDIQSSSSSSGRRYNNNNDAYVRVFNEVLTFASKHSYNLFNSQELSMLSCLINLTNSEKYLLSRLSLRKIKWIRLSRIDHYIQYPTDCSDVDDDDEGGGGGDGDGDHDNHNDRDILSDILRGNDGDAGNMMYVDAEEDGYGDIASDDADRLNIDKL